MAAVDGDILRLRPPGARLEAHALIRLADIVDTFADGAVLLTRRAKLELRGVPDSDAARQALDDAGLNEPASCPRLPDRVLSPATDLDASASGRITPLVSRLDDALRASETAMTLADKFLLAVDGGGALHVGDIAADIRLDAIVGAPQRWRLAVAGNAWDAVELGRVTEADAPAVVVALIERLLGATTPEHRRTLRLRDLPPPQIQAAAAEADDRIAPAAGPIGARNTSARIDARAPTWQAAGFVFGRVESSALRGLADLAQRRGALRLMPDRRVIVPDGRADTRRILATHGAIVDNSDPRAAVEACIGRAGCARGSTDTRADALLCSGAMPNLRAAASGCLIHVSGCEKGCARRAPAAITLVGGRGRYDVVLAGGPSAAPRWRGLSPVEARRRLAALDRAFRRQAKPQESAEAFLARYDETPA